MPMHEAMEQEVPVHDELRYIEMTVETIYRKCIGVQAAARWTGITPFLESIFRPEWPIYDFTNA
jgi:hypothetical protein